MINEKKLSYEISLIKLHAKAKYMHPDKIKGTRYLRILKELKNRDCLYR